MNSAEWIADGPAVAEVILDGGLLDHIAARGEIPVGELAVEIENLLRGERAIARCEALGIITRNEAVTALLGRLEATGAFDPGPRARARRSASGPPRTALRTYPMRRSEIDVALGAR